MTQTTQQQNKKPDGKRLIYFDYFRAIAILLIILGHCYNNWQRDAAWEKTVVNLISGDTALFVFISGFFFHHIYFPKYNYATFIRNKTKFVFLPYLSLSLLYIAYYYWLHGEIVMANVLNEFFGPNLNQLELVLLNLVTGRTLWAYWYVPFVMLVFMLSPVFIRFIHWPNKVKLSITACLFLVSMYVHRPSWEINPLHSLIYYLPYYLLGIIYSMEHQTINRFIQGRALILLAITIITATAMHWSGQTDNAGKASMLAWRGIDYMVLQKLSLIPFMLAFTLCLQKFNIPFLKVMAAMSFALYFLHQWVLSFLRSSGLMDVEHGFIGVLMLCAITTLLSYLLARLLRLLIGKRSRYVIGW